MRARRMPVAVSAAVPRWSLTLVLLWIGTVSASAAIQPVRWECPAPAAASTPEVGATPLAGLDAFPVDGGELTVFAAASLTDAFGELKTTLEAANPDLTITYNFGGSQALVTQLTEGAQADLFVSANAVQMDAAREAGLLAGEPVTVARNRLAIVVPAQNPAAISSSADLAQEGLRLVLAQAEVPAGRYARESVCRMAADAGTYGDEFVARVAANVVSEEEDVRDALAKVVLGEADAAIVYLSDAQSAGAAVQTIEIPAAVNSVATYPVAVVAGGDAALGNAFIAYLLIDQGQEILTSLGFEPVRHSGSDG